MSLARTTTQLATTIIRQLGDDGGTLRRDVEAELNNIIAWAAASPRAINRDTSTVGVVGAGTTTLHTYSLPLSSLQADKDYLKVRYGGLFAANANTKRVEVFFGGVQVSSLGAGLFDQRDGTWVYDIDYMRLSSTSVRASGQIMWYFIARDGAGVITGNGFYASINKDITGLANLNSNATTMEVKGQGAANNDVQQNYSRIELIQQ